MAFVDTPIELTTSATDAMLAVESLVITIYLGHSLTGDRWRTGLWCWVFGLIAFSSFLGAIVHGLKMPEQILAALWKPLYLSLGILVGLFIVGAVHDWRGRTVAARLFPWSIAAGAVFFALTEFFRGGFLVFVGYEASALAFALAIYSFLAATHRLNGAGLIVAAIILNLAAAGVEASDVSIRIIVPFDHNGVFHVVQMAGTAALWLGLRRGMEKAGRPDRYAI